MVYNSRDIAELKNVFKPSLKKFAFICLQWRRNAILIKHQDIGVRLR